MKVVKFFDRGAASVAFRGERFIRGSHICRIVSVWTGDVFSYMLNLFCPAPSWLNTLWLAALQSSMDC